MIESPKASQPSIDPGHFWPKSTSPDSQSNGPKPATVAASKHCSNLAIKPDILKLITALQTRPTIDRCYKYSYFDSQPFLDKFCRG